MVAATSATVSSRSPTSGRFLPMTCAFHSCLTSHNFHISNNLLGSLSCLPRFRGLGK
jgi:hypothetical protein